MWGYEPCCFLTVSFSHAGACAHMYTHIHTHTHTHSHPHNTHTPSPPPPLPPPTHTFTLTHPQHMYTYIYRSKEEGGNLVFVCVVTFTYTLCYSSLHFFEPVSMQCVKNTILQSSQKTCSLDLLPTSLFVECLEQLLPAVTAVINQSLHTGVFPSVFKEAIIKPLLKKPSLDPNSLKNYRPISNLSFLSKVTEKIILSQLSAYLNANNFFPTSQSAYRPGHSTETALLNMMNDILHALNNGDATVVTLLDLSAAFDTIDHNILCQRLEHLYGISGTPLNWFRSYLSNRTQTVTINNKLSQPTLLKFGVPQGSVLGPILFILYTKPLTTLIRRHSISNQSFADDTQLHDSCRPDQIDTSVQGMQDCISDVKTWMTSNKLKLNDDKTECLLIVSNRTSLPNPHIGDTDILFSLQAKKSGRDTH